MTTAPIVSTTQPRRIRSGTHPVQRILRSAAALLSVLWLGGLVVASVTAPLWLPYPPDQQDLGATLQLPSAAHWFGTDELGRDVLSRIFASSGETLFYSAVAAVVALAIAVPLSMLAAARRRSEAVANRATEIAISIPAVAIVLTLVGVIGSNLTAAMAVVGILVSAGLYRIFVGQAKSLQAQPYVAAAKIDGIRPFLISLRHVLPNMLATVFVQFALIFAVGMMIQTGLAFIGFGPPPPAPSWGGMIQTASQHVYDAPFLMVPTGVFLILTVLSANTIADTVAAGAQTPPPQIPDAKTARASRRSIAVNAKQRSESQRPSTTPATEGDLVVDSLTIGVDAGPALVTDLSLTVKSGRVMGMVGESGCGKTVTALSLIGLLPPGLSPRSGSIGWAGRDLTAIQESDFHRLRGREIAFVSQEPTRALDPMFTVSSQLVGAIRRLQGVDRRAAAARAEELLLQVGIADVPRVLSSYPHQISGGMAQRVAIALALAGSPRLLIADEPTTALDVTVQAEILSLLRHLVKESGMSMIIVTHNLGVVADICDDIAVMYAGQIVETGRMVDVLDDPQHPYTMALLAADPHNVLAVQAKRLASIPGQVPAPADWPTGCRFAARCVLARDECTSPVALTPRGADAGSVRCARTVELKLSGADWTTNTAEVRVDPVEEKVSR